MRSVNNVCGHSYFQFFLSYKWIYYRAMENVIIWHILYLNMHALYLVYIYRQYVQYVCTSVSSKLEGFINLGTTV